MDPLINPWEISQTVLILLGIGISLSCKQVVLKAVGDMEKEAFLAKIVKRIKDLQVK